MKKLLTLLLLCFASFIARSQYTPVIANYTISGKPIGYSQATPADGRSMVYDGTNFLYRPYRDSQEVISYLNLAKYRAGNVVYIVDSGGTLNGNGTYTNPHNTFWMFRDGVLDVNLIKLNWTTNSGTCSNCFITTTQLTDSSYKINRTNGTSDTIVIDFSAGVYITTLNNGLTLTGTNGQLGGPLVQNTIINGGGFDLAINGNTFQEGQGAAITSANVITTGHDGNSFSVVGSTQINAITTTNWQAGSHISFIFTGTPLLRNNQTATAGNAPLLLAGGIDYTAATNDVITFLYDGVAWHETSRKLAGSVIPVTANNGLTLTGANLQLGGTLIQNTTIAGNGFYHAISGGRFETGAGLAVVAANDLFVGNDGNLFSITGTTQINAIGTTNWQAGSEISFVFTSIVTLKNNTAGGLNTAPMLLAGSVDYTSAVGDYIGFQYDGTNWHETNRKLAGSVSNITLSNGLTLSGSNGVLGGTLTGNTVIDGSTTFQLEVTGSTTTATGLFYVLNSSGSIATAIRGESANGIGVRGISTAQTGGSFSSTSGFGVAGSSTSLIGVSGSSTTGVAGSFTVSPTSTNTPVTAAQLVRTISGGGTAANGIGVDLLLSSSTTTGTTAGNSIRSTLTDATAATVTSKLVFRGQTGGALMADIADMNGAIANFYGTSVGVSAAAGVTGGSFTGSVTGVFGQSAVVPAWFNNTATTNNTIEEGILIQRVSSVTPATGEGTKIQFDLRNSTPATLTTGNIIHKLTTVTNGAEVSEFDFQVDNAGALSTKFAISGPATFTSATRFETSLGATVVSTGNLTLGTDGNIFHVSGTTTINALTTANWQAGSVISLIFDASVTVKNNTAGGAGTAVMLLAGGADFSATANDVLTLIWDGTSFFEKSRSVN